MNSHKNARLTVEGRKLLIERIAVMGLMPAAEAAGISLRTARKWLRRFEQEGLDGLTDRSSRPSRTRSTVDEALQRSIEQLRRLRMPMRRIAELVGRSVSTVARWLARLGLSSLKALDPVRPVLRYEHIAPGEMLHMDTKKLGRIVRPSHRVTGDRRDSVTGAGWEFAHVAIDDHSRAGFVQMHADERKGSAAEFLKTTVARFAAQGVKIKRLLTDNGPAYRSQLFNKTCQAAGYQAHLYAPLHAADQRQGRTLHPDLPARVGLRPALAHQRGAHFLVARLSRLLQQPPRSFGARLQASRISTR